MKTRLASATAIMPVIGAVYAADAPFMKDGLWSMHMVNTMTSEGKPEPQTLETTMSRCNKVAATPTPATPPEGQDCKKISQSSSGETKSYEMQCTVDGRKTRVKATNTTKGEDENHSVTETSFDPPMNGVSEMKIVFDSKYVGPCPAGMESGDVVMADGTVVHPPKQ